MLGRRQGRASREKERTALRGTLRELLIVPFTVATDTTYMCQWSANDRTSLAEPVLQAVSDVALACMNLDDFSPES